MVNLNDYTEDGIMQFGDTLSFILLIDKLRNRKGESLLSRLPVDYIEKIRLQIPENMSTLLSEVVRVLLDKSGYKPVDAKQIAALAEKGKTKEYGEMFEAVVDYLKESREEAWKEGQEQGIERGRKDVARNALAEGSSIEYIQRITGLDAEIIKKLSNS